MCITSNLAGGEMTPPESMRTDVHNLYGITSGTYCALDSTKCTMIYILPFKISVPINKRDGLFFVFVFLNDSPFVAKKVITF